MTIQDDFEESHYYTVLVQFKDLVDQYGVHTINQDLEEWAIEVYYLPDREEDKFEYSEGC